MAAMLPASAVEQSFKEVFLQGQQTAESGETERSRAGAEASAHECAPDSPEASQITAVVHYLCRQPLSHYIEIPYIKRTTTLELLNCTVTIH